MNDTRDAFWFGFILGMGLILIFSSLYYKQYSSTCEKEFDVYHCDWKYLPVEPTK